ncbi:MAG: LptF/LptG family permease [Armatimonadia bacterium]|nr:LptF/LptG family permease [Armatimonadia bacterium]
MKRIDRYILGNVIPPFLFGIGAFMAVLVGVELLYDMLRLVYQEGFPAWAAVQIFFLELPGVITLTFPMAVMFGSLMAMGQLSGDGELVAMRAGGVSVLRVGLPIMIFGFLISCAGFIINETLVPWSKTRGHELTREMYGTMAAENDMLLEVRNDEGIQRILHAKEFDPETLTIAEAIMLDFTRGPRAHVFRAESVRWQGQKWVMRNVEHTWWDGEREIRATEQVMSIDVGRTPDAVGQARKRPEDMALSELLEVSAVAREEGRELRAQRLYQHYHIRLALPWATLGLAILGIGLGIQRQRSSRGIGMGISLIVLFIYYIILHTLTLVGERGVAHPALMAWTPNALLYLAGVGFLLRSSR